MKIGFTYNLRSKEKPDKNSPSDYYGEYESDETVEGITKALTTLGYEVIQIGNISSLINFLAKNKKIDIVFNMAEGRYGRARESQVPSVLEAYQIPYTFSDPLTLAICLDKGLTKDKLKLAKIPTPDYQVLELNTPIKTALQFPLFLKPLYEGASKGIDEKAIIYTKNELIERTNWLWGNYQQPVLLEKYLSGREFTIGILGTGKDARALGAMEISLKKDRKIYDFYVKENYEELTSYNFDIESPLKENLFKVALDSWRTLQCRDGGRVDIRLDEAGNPHVLEINTLPGLHYIHSDLPIIARSVGMSFTALLDEILFHATKRMKQIETLPFNLLPKK